MFYEGLINIDYKLGDILAMGFVVITAYATIWSIKKIIILAAIDRLRGK